MFFFCFLTLNLLVCVVALVSVLHTYATLANQNWQWWWRSFFTGFSASLWMFVYALWLMISVFKMDVFWSDVVFLLYAGMMSTCFGMMCGAISVIASWVFVTYLYALSKSDWLNWIACNKSHGSALHNLRAPPAPALTKSQLPGSTKTLLTMGSLMLSAWAPKVLH